MLKTGALLATALCLMAGPVSGEPIFATSFEEQEGFQIQELHSQNGWTIYGGNKNRAGVTRLPEAGETVVKVTRGEAHLHHSLTEEKLVEPVTFSIRLRLDPEGGETNEPRCRVYLSNSAPNRRFGGVSFGLVERDGLLAAVCRNETEWEPIPAGSGIVPGTFYRFEVTLYPSTGTYDLRLFEDGSQTALGEITAARFRNQSVEINHLMLNGTPGAYFDEITLTRLE